MYFPEGTCSMEPGSSAESRAAGSQTKVGRAGGEQDGRRPATAPAASLLPPTFLRLLGSSQGSDQKAHTGLSLFCSKTAVDEEEKNWEVWSSTSANMPKMQLRAKLLGHSFHSKRCFEDNPSYHLRFSPACPVSSLPEKSGVGRSLSTFESFNLPQEAVVSSFLVALCDVPFGTVKCLDFVGCAQ